MNATERSIFEQFDFWRKAEIESPLPSADTRYVVIGCGTSYNLAMSVASQFVANGREAIAVPAGEWLHRPQSYLNAGYTGPVHVIALSRSGESTETVKAAQASRKRKHFVTGLTCAEGSALTKNSDRTVYIETHAEEGIVMTASASLMLKCGFELAGCTPRATVADASEALLKSFAETDISSWVSRKLFIFLGGGANYGVAVEGALKMQEMSLSNTQAFHPGEYRHGPVSLSDENAAVMLLYSEQTRAEEEKIQKELSAKGAFVCGIGGPGDLSFPVKSGEDWRALEVLPLLQLFGERVAQAKSLDTLAPRHLTKVVTLS